MKPNFKKSTDGLLPVIIQDSKTNVVLMLGYMNEEALEKTKTENRVTFYSRSKQRLWTKGEESGHFLDVDQVLIDCDEDTILIKASPNGPVCHNGTDTCFKERNSKDFLSELEELITERKTNPGSGSYVSSLFKGGINKIAQKVGEEAIEVVIEAKDENIELFKGEAADLLFHYLILLSAKGCALKDIVEVLKNRSKK
ncbi:MAG: bifunctional phosphoribosyl-AMP cyclohydrolase/phosphoribosyl-ATP diphosphatase HisIE [Bacteroidetes bacterium]|nr:bifunctional phosphoribosyl-AMP cyclohydrolase/phosphoribosyl-ATP diphosphatase HisIE [Bacteroidota bacterium]